MTQRRLSPRSIPGRPFVLLKAATSLDGFIDDGSGRRKIFSNDADTAAVVELRRDADAILVGAETIRRDDPKLITGGGARPIKVGMTLSGNLDPQSSFFRLGDARKLIYTSSLRHTEVRQRLAAVAEVIAAGADSVDLSLMLEDLKSKGVDNLLVEGGAKLIAEFLRCGLADRIRLAVSSELIGGDATTLLRSGFSLPLGSTPRIVSSEVLQGMLVVEATL